MLSIIGAQKVSVLPRKTSVREELAGIDNHVSQKIATVSF